MIPKYYFQVICCPKCKSDLEVNPRNEEELMCSNCNRTYPVTEGIPILVDGAEDEVSQIIKRFYDSEWKRNENGTLRAKAKHEDLSNLGQKYIQTNEDRFMPLFTKGKQTRDFFLDAASGAQPRINFGANYSYHVCLDFALDGLIECKRLLGDRAICICGSLLNMPIKSMICDGIIVSHCLYHIDKDLQLNAISELSRVLSYKGTVLIFYGNPNSFERRILTERIVTGLKNIMEKKGIMTGRLNSYYYAHPLNHMLDMLSSQFSNSKITAKPLRFFTRKISQPAFMNRFLGEMFFRLFVLIENLLKEKANLASYVSYIVENRGYSG